MNQKKRVMYNCIEEKRKAKRIPVKDFLDDLGIPRSNYYRFIKNETQPSYELIEKIAEYLHLSIEDLCSFSEETEQTPYYNTIKAEEGKTDEANVILESHKLFLAYRKKYGKEKASNKRRELMNYYLEDKLDLMFSDILLMSLELDVAVTFLENPSKEQYFQFANRFI